MTIKISEIADMSEKGPDDDSVYAADASPNSEGSSSRSKRLLEGGPYGDGPHKPQQLYRDSVVFILQGTKDSTETSDCSEPEADLYSLKNEYLQKLKIIRRKLETIHPFTLRYNELEKESSPNSILELEYNPPKKKSCIRVKTPQLESESNIPYRTKISLHDNLFRNTSEKAEQTEKTLSQEVIDKFTVTREVQCYEDELDSALGSSYKSSIKTKINGDSVSVKKSADNSLFPKVIIKYDQSRQMQDSTSTSNSASIKLHTENVDDNLRINLPNYVEESSGECCSLVTSTTIIDSAKCDKPNIKNVKIRRKPFLQYITYRKENDRAKSTPIKMKTLVPFGPIILHDQEQKQHIDSRFYWFDSTSVSAEENNAEEEVTEQFDSNESSDKLDKTKSERFCNGLCCCFERFFSLFSSKSGKTAK